LEVINNIIILTAMIGTVSSPHAKNSRKITTSAWNTLGSPIPDV
jgi:hypothetical protein